VPEPVLGPLDDGVLLVGVLALGVDVARVRDRHQLGTGQEPVPLGADGEAPGASRPGWADPPAATGYGEGADAGAGVLGITASATGLGVLAENTSGGTAFRAIGPAVFDTTATFSRSGTVVIPSGVKTATITPSGGLTSSALVLALMQNVAGGVMVKAAVPNPARGPSRSR
jgi:hypothetical protein